MPGILTSLPLQDLGLGSEIALRDRIHETVMDAFDPRLVFWPFIPNKTNLVGRVSKDVVKISRMSHTLRRNKAQDQTSSGEPKQTSIEITLDDFPINAGDYIDYHDLVSAPWDHLSRMSRTAGMAIARALDKDVARTMILGARTADVTPTGTSFVFYGGSLLASPRSGPIATAYPASTTGSGNFRTDLAEIRQAMADKNQPTDNLTCFTTGYIISVLLKDTTLTSRDWNDGTNDLLRRRMVLVDDWMVVEVPKEQFPQDDDTNTTINPELNTKYRANYSKTVAICVNDPTQLECVYSLNGVQTQVLDIPLKKAYWVGAEIKKGCGVVSGAAFGEIAIA